MFVRRVCADGDGAAPSGHGASTARTHDEQTGQVYTGETDGT